MRPLDETSIYYVYEHYKPNCDEPFYVGKGHSRRAHERRKRNLWWNNIVNKHGLEIRFVAKNLSEMEAFWLENMCIKGWGRANLGEGPLVNLTDGGEGGSGWVPSTKYRKAARKRNLANPPFLNKHHTNVTKKIIADKATGRKQSASTRLLKSKRAQGKNNSMYGRKRPIEWCLAHSKRIKGTKRTEESKTKQRNTIRGNRWVTHKITGKGTKIGKNDLLPRGYRFGKPDKYVWGLLNIKTGKIIEGSIKKLTKYLNVSKDHIRNVFRGNKIIGNFIIERHATEPISSN